MNKNLILKSTMTLLVLSGTTAQLSKMVTDRESASMPIVETVAEANDSESVATESSIEDTILKSTPPAEIQLQQPKPEESKTENADDDKQPRFIQSFCPDASDAPDILMPLNKDHNLENAVPDDLVAITPHIPTKEGRAVCLNRAAAVALYELIQDAKSDDVSIIVTSGYRSFGHQKALFDEYVRQYQINPDRIAPAGTSEHQLGTTVDLTSPGIDLASGSAEFANTPEGIWMEKNSWKYGFIMSYPDGKEDETGYPHESWHFRYIGAELAKQVHKSGTTLYEFLANKN